LAFNTFGRIFTFTTWGESHGPAVGVVIDGVPSNFLLDLDFIREELERRRPGKQGTSPRKETDLFEVLSGLHEGKTLGTPICFVVKNKDRKSGDYDTVSHIYRPGHADFTWHRKFHHVDHRGGGRSSARETVGRVIAGAVAKLFLRTKGISIGSKILHIGDQLVTDENSPEKLALQAKHENDSVGGMIEIRAEKVPPGLGEPVYDRLDARIASALMGINAVKSVEIGSGIASASMKGTQHNDPLSSDGFTSNNAGGILGGISNGMPILTRIALKPTPSISQEQNSINHLGQPAKVTVKGRHDPCVALRAGVIAEAMLACVLLDFFLLNKMRRW
jgi:chorismate synthase